jgi:hypothetical protein
MFSPVCQDDEVPVSRAARIASLRGFTLAVIDVRKLLTNAVTTSPVAANFLGEITIFDADADSDVRVIQMDNSKGSDLSGSTKAVAVIDAGFGLKCVVQLRPTRAMMVSMFSSEHYIVGGIGILLTIICATIINAILTARDMPNDPPGVGNLGDGRKWLPSKWQTG